MPTLEPGLVHTPVTPFTADRRIDYDLFARLIEFHLRNGADALALPMHAGESVSLPAEEKRALVAFAVKQARARVPVIAHVSDAGTALAADLARAAEAAGAAAVVATTPYYWTPPAQMIVEHFARIGAAVTIPFYVLNSPDDMAGSRIGTDTALALIERLDNFAGVVDASLDWQFMLELMDRARPKRPGLQLIAGNELMVSAAAIGAAGMFSSLAAIAPKLVRELHDACRADRLFEARAAQEQVAALRQLLKPHGIGGLKAALHALGRDCGDPRPPNRAVTEGYEKLATEILAMPALKAEPRGW